MRYITDKVTTEEFKELVKRVVLVDEKELNDKYLKNGNLHF